MRRATHCGIAVLIALTALCWCAACGSDNPPDSANTRGEVVSTTSVLQLSAEETMAYLAAGKLDTPVRNGVDAFRVVYRTIDPGGAATTASGLVVLPRTDSRRLRVVDYAHGTMVLKSDAPSVREQNGPDRARTVMFAAIGYAVVAPDYLGLGEGPGFHPYTHAPTEVSASIDLLRAARAVAADRHRELDPGVLVTGFSQGGEAATALAKALDAGPADFGLAALAPVSGPYDVREVETPGALDGRVAPGAAVFYLAYWITSMNRIYHLYDQPADAFTEPVADRIEELFDGQHSDFVVATSLPVRPELLLTPEFLALARDPSGAALRAVEASDGTCDWTPRVPVRLYAASGDRNVLFANSEHCVRDMRSDKVTLTDLGDLDHSGSARAAYPQILDWFQQEVPPL